MTVPTISKTVGQLVAERPELGRVFERLGIDYCCGGRRPLGEVCKQRGLNPGHVLAQLEDSDATPATSIEPDWAATPLSQLADHIEATHHELMRREIIRVGGLVQKVAGVHGLRHPELLDLQKVFTEFTADLISHMGREEAMLFPWIRALEAGAVQDGRTGRALDQPIHRMMQEHDDAGTMLAKMRELTNGFTPPLEACGSYRVMLSGLRDIESDMHAHVHKENNILFPRALALEANGPAAA